MSLIDVPTAAVHKLSLAASLLPDGSPGVQSPFGALALDVSLPAADAAAAATDRAYGGNLDGARELDALSDAGQALVRTVYSLRSASKAIPVDSEVVGLDQAAFGVLRFQVAKISDLMAFHDRAVSAVCTHVALVATSLGRARLVPLPYLNAVARLIDTVATLDALKDAKQCLKADVTRYRRCLHHVRRDLPDADALTVEADRMKAFLENVAPPSTPYRKRLLLHTLRAALQRVAGYPLVLLDLMGLSAGAVERGDYHTPEDKHRHLRLVPTLMMLLDDASAAESPFKLPKAKLAPLHKLARANPVVPCYRDVVVWMDDVLMLAPHYDRVAMGAQWGAGAKDKDADRKKAAARYSIVPAWDAARGACSGYLAKLALCLKGAGDAAAGSDAVERTAEGAARAGRVAACALEGLQLLRDWKCAILEAVAWKLANPALGNADISASSHVYDRVLRQNLSPSEVAALADMVSMTKSLGAALRAAEPTVAPSSRLSFHWALQSLVKADLVPALHRADKRRRPIKEPLLKLRALAGDWGGKLAPKDDYVKYSRKAGKVRLADMGAAHRPRIVGPAPAQLCLVRVACRELYHESNIRDYGILGKPDLEKEDVEALKTLHQESFWWPCLLEFGASVESMANLGELWYRELFLDLTGRVQFPIEMSLPWILAEPLVAGARRRAAAAASAAKESKKKGKKQAAAGGGSGGGGVAGAAPLVEALLHCMDLYNDAASDALLVLKQRFLFDEVEAEVNLVFDQIVFLVADDVYGHAKNQSALALLDREFRNCAEECGAPHAIAGPQPWLDALLQQRHLRLLGRSIDFNLIVAQRVEGKLSRDLDACLRRFEACSQGAMGMSTIAEVEHAVACVRGTHARLAAKMTLAPFEVLYADANEGPQPGEFDLPPANGLHRSRMVNNVLLAVADGLAPNSGYNAHTRRFTPSPVGVAPAAAAPDGATDKNGHDAPGGAPATSAKLSADLFGERCCRHFESMHALERGFFGAVHARALVRLLSGTELAALSAGLLELLERSADAMRPLVDALFDGLPPCRLPKFLFGGAACYGFFQGKLRTLSEYGGLRDEVFQAFRELGNVLAFVELLASALGEARALKRLDRDALFSGGRGKGVEHIDAAVATWEAFARRASPATLAHPATGKELHHQLATLLDGSGGEACLIGGGGGLADVARGLWPSALARLRGGIEKCGAAAVWRGLPPANHVVEIENARGFNRLWSALSFLFAGGGGANGAENVGEFGHGFHLAGLAVARCLDEDPQLELLDFSRHVVRAFDHDAAAADASTGRSVGAVDGSLSAEAEAFVARVRATAKLEDALLAMLRAGLPKGSGGTGARTIKLFHPPPREAGRVPVEVVAATGE